MKTLEKTDFIKSNGYNLVEVWENDWKIFIRSIRFIQKNWRKRKLKKLIPNSEGKNVHL